MKSNRQQKTFAKGADIGWLQQMEATGYKFYNNAGEEEECLKILKDHGINTIRLRTWVNPSDNRASGHNSKAETVTMAVRAQQMGMRIMIDFHYSDSWADPGKQKKPAAWEGHPFPQLLQDVYDYTYDVMNDLKKAGVQPQWVQVGNETPGGMIYPLNLRSQRVFFRSEQDKHRSFVRRLFVERTEGSKCGRFERNSG